MTQQDDGDADFSAYLKATAAELARRLRLSNVTPDAALRTFSALVEDRLSGRVTAIPTPPEIIEEILASQSPEADEAEYAELLKSGGHRFEDFYSELERIARGER